jgi:vacuolar-type H+-ATPase subunit F/Vma7
LKKETTMRFVKSAGLPKMHSPAQEMGATFGAIVLLRMSDQTDQLMFRGFNRETLACGFTMRGVKIDPESSEEDNLSEVHAAIDDTAGLLVIVMHDASHECPLKCKMEAEALKRAVSQKVPTLLIVPSWDHVYRRQLGKDILANVRGAFMHFRQDSRNNTLMHPPQKMLRSVKHEDLLYWPRWQGKRPIQECLRRIVRPLHRAT